MAPKDVELKSNKRKRPAVDKLNKSTKKVEDSKLKIKPKQQKQQLNKTSDSKPKSFQNRKPVVSSKVDNNDLSKKEQSQLTKEQANTRKKKRKPHYTLERELAMLWEKMRHRNISKEERSKFVSEALQKMKGKIPEIASCNVSSRVLQMCIKFCSETEKNAVYEEIRPHLLTLSANRYAVHLVTKMFDNASKTQLPGLVSLLHGHVASLLVHSVGSIVVECAYQVGNATQKRELLTELYSKELQLFKDLANMKETRIGDIISKLGLNKSSVLKHMSKILQKILKKGIVDHSITHKALLEYLTIADKSSAVEVVKRLSGPLLVRMVHTRDGSRIGMLCVKHGSAKERKKLVKAMKGHIGNIARDSCGNLVLVSILSTVDDTKLVSKIVIRELQTMLKELVLDKCGRRPLLQLLHPYCQRYLSPDDLACLNSSIPALYSNADQGDGEPAENLDEDTIEKSNHDSELPTVEADEDMESEVTLSTKESKKEPLVRRQELLLKSGLAKSLVDICIESPQELLMSNIGREVLYEVATGGVDGILHPALDEQLTSLYGKIAALAAEPKLDESEHILENFHSSRTIRKLVLDCPTFASVLWKMALKGNCKTWAEGYSSKIIAAFAESSDPNVRKLTQKELKPLIDGGILKINEAKTAEK